MNKVIISGRWTKDIEFKALENGALAKCSLASDEGYGDKKHTNFFDVVMFGKLAESVTNHSSKGRKVLIEGRMRQERWEKDGRQQSAVRVYADAVEFLDYKDEAKKESEPVFEGSKTVNYDPDDLPF